MPSFVRSAGFHQRLRACLASLPDDVASAAGQLASLQPGEWPEFLDYAASHGVLAILAPVLSRCDLPPAIRQDVERRLLVQSMWSQHVVEELSRLLDLFVADRIAV